MSQTVIAANDEITAEVTSWPGVEASTGSRGEWAFKIGKTEIGHLHGDRVAHFFFGKELWTKLFEQGRITYHPVFPDRVGPASRSIESEDDVRDVIDMLRLNYDRLSARKAVLERALDRPV